MSTEYLAIVVAITAGCATGNEMPAAKDDAASDAGSSVDAPVEDTGSDVAADGPLDASPVVDGAADALDAPKSGTWRETARLRDDTIVRANFVAVWATTTREMLAWGGTPHVPGESCPGLTEVDYCIDGEAYAPATDHWSQIPPAPIVGRDLSAFAWSGTQLLVWGGFGRPVGTTIPNLADGAAFDPATRTWTKLPAAPIAGRGEASVVFATTTNELIVWGGDGTTRYADGAAYDVVKKTWRMLAPSPLSARSRVPTAWDGTHMVVMGGFGPTCVGTAGQHKEACHDGATYDPATDKWSAIVELPDAATDVSIGCVLPTGPSAARFTMWGGSWKELPRTFVSVGQTFDASTGVWTSIASPDDAILPGAPRGGSACFFDGTRMFAWGGIREDGSFPENGAIYDATSATWSAMPPGGPKTDAQPVVWTGTEAIVPMLNESASGTNRWMIYHP